MPEIIDSRQQLGLNQIQEMLEEDISEPTELHHGEHNLESMQYGPAMEAIGNQLEINSMISEHNSVINTSPVRQSRVRSSRHKGKIPQ